MYLGLDGRCLADAGWEFYDIVRYGRNWLGLRVLVLFVPLQDSVFFYTSQTIKSSLHLVIRCGAFLACCLLLRWM